MFLDALPFNVNNQNCIIAISEEEVKEIELEEEKKEVENMVGMKVQECKETVEELKRQMEEKLREYLKKEERIELS